MGIKWQIFYSKESFVYFYALFECDLLNTCLSAWKIFQAEVVNKEKYTTTYVAVINFMIFGTPHNSDMRLIRLVTLATYDFCLFQKVQTVSGGHTASYSVDTGGLYLREQSGRAPTCHSSPSSAQIKNEWSHSYAPPMCLHGVHRHITL